MAGLPYNMRVNVNVPFPALVRGIGPFLITKANGIWTFALSYLGLTTVQPGTDPSVQQILIYNVASGIWQVTTLAAAVLELQTEQDITSGATVEVATNDGMIKINKAIGSATSVILPPAATKVGPVTVSDFKMDSDQNPITVSVSGTDTLPGGRTQWVIEDPGWSMTFYPLRDGSGYAIGL